MASYDALIVGARVAGAATALRLASAGARVLLVDRDPAIGDTLSTHALMRPGVELLARWGLLDDLLEAGTPYVRQAVFQYGRERVTVPIRPTETSLGLVAPRRFLLDRVILDAALAAGAELSLGTAIDEVVLEHGRAAGAVLRSAGGRRTVAADLIVGADGRGSRTAECVGAPLVASSPHRTATVYGYFPGIENQGYRWFFGDGVSAGAIPTNDGLHCVFAACRPRDYKSVFAEPLAGMQAILRRLRSRAGGHRGGARRAAPPFCRRTRPYSVPGWPWLGARRRRRILQGSRNGARCHRRASRCALPFGSAHSWRSSRLCGGPATAVAGVFRDDPGDCQLRLAAGRAEGAARGPERLHEAGAAVARPGSGLHLQP